LAPDLTPEIPMKEVVVKPMSRCGAAPSFCSRTGSMHHVIRLGLVSCLALIPASASRSLAEDAASFERTVRPLLTRHCVSCHGGNEPAANMRLDMPEASFANAAARASWEKVHSQLVRGEMPPPDMPRLSADDLDTLTSWIRRESERGLIAERGAASRTVMRRLTRVEYARLLADVLGLEFQNVRLSLHEKLPLDPQGEGPVNDGELLRFETLHFQSYVDLAERAVAAVIVDGDRPEPFTYEIDPRTFGPWKGSMKKPFGLEGKVAPVASDGDSRLAGASIAANSHAEELARTDAGGVRLTAKYGENNGIQTLGTWFVRLPFFRPVGILRIRIRAGAIIPPGEGAPVMRVSINSDVINEKFTLDVASITVTNPADDLQDYVVEVPLGLLDFPYVICERSGKINVQICNDYAPISDRVLPPREKGKPQEWPWQEPQLVIDHMEITGPGNDSWPTRLHREVTAAGEDVADEQARAAAILRDMATRAWRRPVTEEETGPLVELYRRRRAEGQSRDGALREPLVAVLVSPHALYLVEHKAATPAPLSGLELANRLSFFLWGGRPDGELSALGISGKLQDPAVLAAQVERMIDDPRSRVFTEDFVTRLLLLDRLAQDPIDFGLVQRTFSKSAAAEAREQRLKHDLAVEPVRYFEHLLRNDRPVQELIAGDSLMVNDRLARFYGLDGVEGEEFRVVAAPAERRLGWLTMAGVVAAASRGTTEPTILRGVYILDRFLGEHPGTPPGNVEPLEAQSKAGKDRRKTPLRERIAMHTEVATCALCHRKIDPLGFAWGDFDHLGQKVVPKADKPGGPVPTVDCSGKLPDGREFPDLAGFAALVQSGSAADGATARYRFGELLIRRLTAYALSRPINLADDALIRGLVQRAERDGWRLRELIKSIVGTDSFTRG
jgi:cytochrome c553